MLSLLWVAHQESSWAGFATVLTCTYQHFEAQCKARASVGTRETRHARLRLTTAKGDVHRLTRAALQRY